MPFDAQGARRAGYSWAEILPELQKDDPSFDVEGARKAGYDDEEIGKFMSTGTGYDGSAGGRVGAMSRGFNTGLSNVLGAPVDAVNWALDKVGVPVSEKPLFGSESIKSGLDTVGGAAARALGGQGRRLTYDSVGDLPPVERPFAIGGEIIGSSVLLASAPLVAARVGAKGPALLKPVMDMARSRPGLFAASEAGSAMGAAQGGALAEVLRPGDKTAGVIGEIAGALVNPVGSASRLATRTIEAGKNAIATRVSQAGRESRAADYLRKTFEQTGEDPSVAIRMLQQPDEFGLTLTAGQITNSPTLLAVEKKLGESNHRFMSQADTWSEEGLKTLRESADTLASTGDPRALAEAVKLRASYFDKLISGRLSEAERTYRDAATRMGSGDPAVARQASESAYEALEGALADARRIEGELWGRIDRTVQVPTSATETAYQRARERLLPQENLPAPVEAFMQDLNRLVGARPAQRVARTTPAGKTIYTDIPAVEGTRAPVAAADLLRLRSRALQLAKNARAAVRSGGDGTLASHLMAVADGALDDLRTVQGPAADEARAFSRALHDRFTRSFGGRALGETPTGDMALDPELMLDRAFGGGRSRGDVQMRELREAAAFPEGSTFAEPMGNAQEQFLRNMAARIVDPASGAVNPQRLAGFMRDNQAIINRFPQYARDLANLQTAQGLVDQARALPQRASAVARKTSAFGALLRGQDPAVVIGKALDDPIQYQALINTVRNQRTGSQGAIDGLRVATLDNVIRRSTDADGTFSFARFRQNLTVAPRGRRSLLDTMQSQGVMSEGQAGRLRAIINRADRLEQAVHSGAQINSLVEQPDALTDFLTRVVGSKIGAAIPGQHTLIQQSAGSKFARNVFDKVPGTRITEVLIQAAEDPKLMQKLLARAPTPASRVELQRQLNAALIQAGMIPDDRPTEREKR